MKIRCPQCKNYFDFDPADGPACCPHEGCGWAFANPSEEQEESLPDSELPGLHELSTSDNENMPVPVEETAKPDRTGRGLPSRREDNISLPRIDLVRCPGCRTPVPDSATRCHVCGTNLEKAFADIDGVRAVFDVSGDITFTPRMVVFLFLATLAAFLTFTWILSNRNKGEDYIPLVITDTESPAESELDPALQGVSFLQLKNEFLDPKITDLRKDVIIERFTGQRVIWTGLVKTVGREENNYQIDLVMEGPESQSFVTLQALKIPDNEKKVANITRGQTILFSGKISDFDIGGAASSFNYFRIVLRDGILLK